MIKKEALQKYARQLGFGALGVSGPEPLLQMKRILNQRREEGLLSPLCHKNLDSLIHPQRVFPGLSSIIVVLLPYYHETPAEPEGGDFGVVSRYAWGQDYHLVMQDRLQKLQEYLISIVPWAAMQAFVDGGPTLEKALAVRAGLGFWGKNNLLITREWGSWVFIGEIFTDIQLEPDSPVNGGCGDCLQCVEICPTSALRPYCLNPFLCISQATMVGDRIQEEVVAEMGNKIWGCDDCQLVCPYNREVQTGIGALAPEEGIGPYPSLKRILSLTPQAFQRQLGSTALGWRGLKQLQKNAAQALANRKGGHHGETDLC